MHVPRLLLLLSAPVAISLAAMSMGACIASAPDSLHHVTDKDDAGEPAIDSDASTTPPDDGSQPSDPHAVLGASPAHGPFLGGERVIVSGKGFGADVRIWIGDIEVDQTTLVPIDTTRAQVTVPPGKAGAAEVATQNGDDESTRRSLAGGYFYDQIIAQPDSGPVSGGTVIEIIGQDTAWDATTVAKIDQKPCTTLTVDSPTSIACTVPQGTPGAKTLSVQTGGETISVLDGYTYEDSDNGFKGGLSGAPLDGQLTVLVYDNFSGDAIAGAHAVVGTDIATALIQDADFSGVAVIVDPSLTSPQTVTVAARCHSPITFVDVPVDTVTVYLDPVLSPECASSGDPPLGGGKPQHVGTVTGELVWEGGIEFKKAPWTNIPAPVKPEELQTAYVFLAASDPTQAFALPSAGYAITPLTPGEVGYEFSMSAPSGNRALYAIAGIEDRSVAPPIFTAYAMGVVRGVPVLPNAVTSTVYISMTSTLDQALSWSVTSPTPGPKGPDRLRATVSVMLGNDGYALLPAGLKTPYLPVSGGLSFIGVPPLTGTLFGSSYLSNARAVTGANLGTPLSVIARMLTTTTSQVVGVNGFISVPTLVTPAINGAWDGNHLAATFPSGGALDLSVYDITSGNGLMHWLVAVPKGDNAVTLPSLNGFELASLPVGPVVIGVIGARVDSFDYANLRYSNLRTSGMSAYSLDYFSAHL